MVSQFLTADGEVPAPWWLRTELPTLPKRRGLPGSALLRGYIGLGAQASGRALEAPWLVVGALLWTSQGSGAC